jgi:hypothetical protein
MAKTKKKEVAELDNNSAASGESTATTADAPVKNKAKVFIKYNYKMFLAVAVAIVIILLAYGYIHTKSELKRLSDPKTAAQNQADDLTAKVGKLIILPTDDTPTLATVKDSQKLKNQEFFARAKDGDKILYYPKSSRAVLYRPSLNKVVEYSKVNLNNSQ